MSEPVIPERKPSRRQIVFNWIMGEDLADHDGYWSGSDGVKSVDELLAALDKDAEAKVAELSSQIRRLMAERDLLLGAIASEDYAKIKDQMVQVSESTDGMPR